MVWKRKSAISLHQISLFKTWKWHTPYQNASAWSVGHDLRPTRPLWPRQSWDPRVDQKKSYESSLLPWLKGMTLARPITPVHSVHIQKISRVTSNERKKSKQHHPSHPASRRKGRPSLPERKHVENGVPNFLMVIGHHPHDLMAMVAVPRPMSLWDPPRSRVGQPVSNTRRSALIGTWARKALLVVIGDQTWHGEIPNDNWF